MMYCPECRSASVRSLGKRNWPYSLALLVVSPLFSLFYIRPPLLSTVVVRLRSTVRPEDRYRSIRSLEMILVLAGAKMLQAFFSRRSIQ